MFISTEAKIYKIYSNENPDDECYIGSTCLTILEDRLSRHKKDYALWKLGLRKDGYTIFNLLDKYPLESFVIILLEKPEVANQQELFAREKYFICSIPCINKNMKPAKTIDKRKTDNPYLCECGVFISRLRDKQRHEQSKAHVQKIKEPVRKIDV